MINEDADAWFNRGYLQYERGDLEGAIASYNKAIEFKPDDDVAWYNRGGALKKLGRNEEAIACFDQAIKFQPGCHQAWNNRGLVLYELGRIEEAIASYKQAIKFKPNFHEAWNNRGFALFKLERFEEAIACFDEALVIKRDDHKVWNNRGIALAHFGNLEAALASFDQALAIKSDFYQAWNNRGILLCDQLGQYEEALASFDQAIKFKPDYHDAWYNRGIALGHLEDFEGAINSFDKALAIKPDYYSSLSLEKTATVKQLQRDHTDSFRRFIAKTQKPIQKKILQYQLEKFQQLTVDILLQSGELIKAINTAEEGKNAFLSWLFSDEYSPKYTEIQQLLNPAIASVYWHLSPYALHTFIIKSGESTPIVIESEIDSLTRLDEFEKWVKKWNQEYAKGKGEKQEGGAQTWRDNLEETLKELGNILNIATIEEAVKGIKNLILIPHRDLLRFPIHALFGDEFIISYLPSAKLGLGLAEKQKDGLANKVKLLSIEHPKSESEYEEKNLLDLPFANVESEYICRFFPNNQRLARGAVTLAEVEKHLLDNYSIIHFTGHASYNFHTPSKSAFCLTGKQRLRVENILEMDLSQCELVSLSACETAITGNQTITTEYVGLVSAFLSRGVSRVASTLWTVQSDAAGLVMMKFYQLRQDKSDVEALNEAARWLRDLTAGKLVEWYQAIMEELPKDSSIRPDIRAALFRARKQTPDLKLYAHPYYWAPFIITGITR